MVVRLITCILLLVPALIIAADKPDIGYLTVKQAIEGLMDTPGTDMKIHNEWTVITQKVEGQPVIWSFPPQGHYAYPSVAKREILKDEEGWYVDTTLLCEAETVACDQFYTDFQALDKKMTEAMAGSANTN